MQLVSYNILCFINRNRVLQHFGCHIKFNSLQETNTEIFLIIINFRFYNKRKWPDTFLYYVSRRHCKLIDLRIRPCMISKERNYCGQKDLQIEVLWVVTPYNVAVGYQSFGRPCCLDHQGEVTLKMVSYRNTSRCHNSEDPRLESSWPCKYQISQKIALCIIVNKNFFMH